MAHTIEVKIYYEDTDCGNVVYYANYLRYFERARTEFLEDRDCRLKELMSDGIYFTVVEASIKYLRPGRYGDTLLVETSVAETGHASIIFEHAIKRKADEELLVTGRVKLGSVSEKMRPVRLPGPVAAALSMDGSYTE